MTKRAKIAAKHRDAVRDVKSVPDVPSTGTKRARNKPRPWIVEYCAEKNTKKVGFLFKHDGQWHQFPSYRGYENEKAARSAMQKFRLQQESWDKHFRNRGDLTWRVRDIRIPE